MDSDTSASGTKRAAKVIVSVLTAVAAIVGLVAVTTTAMVGLVQTDIKVRQSILDLSTAMSAFDAEVMADDISNGFHVMSTSWRRLQYVRCYERAACSHSPHQPLFSAAMDQFLLAHVSTHRPPPSRAFSNDTLLPFLSASGASFLWVSNSSGCMHGISMQPGGGFQIVMYQTATASLLLYTLDSQGQRISPATTVNDGSLDPRKRPWYNQAIQANGTVSWSTPYGDGLGTGLVITVSQALRDTLGNHIFACDVSYRKLRDILGRIPLRNHTSFDQVQALFLSSTGGMLASSIPEDDVALTRLYSTSMTQSVLVSPGVSAMSALTRGAAQAMATTPSCWNGSQLSLRCKTAATNGALTSTLVNMRRFEPRSMTSGQQWAVVYILPNVSVVPQHLPKIIVSVALAALLLFVAAGVAVNVKLRGTANAWCCSRPRTGAGILEVELQDWTHSSREPKAAGIVAPPDKRVWRLSELTVLNALSISALVVAFVVWGQVIGEYDSLAATEASALSDLVQANVHAIIRQPQQILQQFQTAVTMGQLPFDPAVMIAEGTAVRNVSDSMFIDMMTIYNAAFVPVSAIIMGYPNGDSYGAEFHQGVIKYRYRNAASGGDLVFDKVVAGQRDRSVRVGLSLNYVASLRPWYTVAMATQPSGVVVFSPVYLFAAIDNAAELGLTAALRLTEPSTGRTMVLGIDLTLSRLTSEFNDFAPSAADGVMFLAEQAPDLPLLATSTVQSPCGSSKSSRMSAFAAAPTGSPYYNLATETSHQLSSDCSAGCSVTLGHGLQKTIATVVALQANGLQWVLSVGIFNVAFLRDLVPFDNVVMIVAAAAAWYVLATVTHLRKRSARLWSRHRDGAADTRVAPSHSLLELLRGSTLAQPAATAALATVGGFMHHLIQQDRSQQVANPVTLAKQPSAADSRRHSLFSELQWDPAADPIWRALCLTTSAPAQHFHQPNQQAVEHVVFRFVKLCMSNAHPTKLVSLLLLTDFNVTYLHVARLIANRWWLLFMQLSVWASMALVGWECNLAGSLAAHPYTLLAETLLVGVQLVNLCGHWYISRSWRWLLYASALSDADQRTGSAAHIIIGRVYQRAGLLLAHSLLLGTIAADVTVRWFVPYSLNEFAPSLMLPGAAVLRPLLLFVYSPQIRSCVMHLAVAMTRSKAVFALMWSVLLCLGLITMVLLHDTVTPPDAFAQGLTDIRATLLSLFTFLFTQANYWNIVVLAIEQSPWMLVYMTIVTFLGVMLLVSLLIASFQSSYAEAFDQREATRTAMRRARQRVGVLIAYRCLHAQTSRLLSLQRSSVSRSPVRRASSAAMSRSNRAASSAEDGQQLSQASVMSFFAHNGIGIAPPSITHKSNTKQFETFAHDVDATFQLLKNMIATNGCDAQFRTELDALATRCRTMHQDAQKTLPPKYSDVSQFVKLCEKHCGDRPVHAASAATARSRAPQTSTWLRPVRNFFDDRQALPYLASLDVLLKLYAAALTLATTFVHSVADVVVSVIFTVLVVEVVLRVVVEGREDVWVWHRLHRRDVKTGATGSVLALRVDAVIMTVATVLLVVDQFVPGSAVLTGLGTTLPALRLFIVSPSKRGMTIGLFGQLPDFAPLVLFQLIVMYVYVVVGCWWFGGQLQTGDTNLEFANFDSLPAAVAVLLQLLSGDSWTETMYATVQARGSLYPIIYFLTFVLFFVLMFTNVAIGIIVEAYQNIEAAKARAHLTQQAMEKYNAAQRNAQLARIKALTHDHLERWRQRRMR